MRRCAMVDSATRGLLPTSAGPVAPSGLRSPKNVQSEQKSMLTGRVQVGYTFGTDGP